MPLYSHSRLNSFEKCPLHYKYRYLDRIPSEVENVEAFTGKRVHEVLEEYFRAAGSVGTPAAVQEAMSRFDRLWEENWSDRVRVVKSGFVPDDYRRLGRACLENFFRLGAEARGGKTVGIEERITVQLDPAGKYRMQGYIDRLVLADDGIHEIHDFKTGKRLPSQNDFARDRQLAIYHLGLQERLGKDTPVRLVWHYLYFGKSVTSSRTPEELTGLRRDLIGRIRTIESATEFPPHVTPLCRWCEYETICPARRKPVSSRRPGEIRARVEEGARLVDGYVAEMGQGEVGEKRPEPHREKIKEALLAFSRREGMEAIVGKTHVARVRKRPQGDREIQIVPLSGGQLRFFD